MALKIVELKEWVYKALQETCLNGTMRDAHIDQFASYRTNNKQETFKQACRITNAVATISKNYNVEGVGVYLHLDLISNSKLLKGAPQNLTQLIELIDIYHIPEVVVYKMVNSVDVVLNEFYRVPIRFEISLLNDGLAVLYKEWRTHSEEEFQREVNFILPIPA